VLEERLEDALLHLHRVRHLRELHRRDAQAAVECAMRVAAQHRDDVFCRLDADAFVVRIKYDLEQHWIRFLRAQCVYIALPMGGS